MFSNWGKSVMGHLVHLTTSTAANIPYCKSYHMKCASLWAHKWISTLAIKKHVQFCCHCRSLPTTMSKRVVQFSKEISLCTIAILMHFSGIYSLVNLF